MAQWYLFDCSAAQWFLSGIPDTQNHLNDLSVKQLELFGRPRMGQPERSYLSAAKNHCWYGLNHQQGYSLLVRGIYYGHSEKYPPLFDFKKIFPFFLAVMRLLNINEKKILLFIFFLPLSLRFTFLPFYPFFSL